ncbi:MAG TPA: PAS domain S-box protein [Spirochaetota bacterium]|nr:PAS domain S-box protein [Spirochaetota bacterium]
MRILLVDNDIYSSQYLELLLSLENHKILTTYKGEECFLLIENHNFDLVILNLYLPDISGIEVLKKIREKHSASSLPVLAVALQNDESTIVAALKIGANDFILKPYEEMPLKVRIRNLLKIKESDYELQKSIEAQKLLIENQKIIFNHLPIGLMILDKKCAVKSANKFAENLFGKKMKSGEILCGDMINCVNAVPNEGMCGKLENCASCMIRDAIEKTFQTEKSKHKNSVKLNIFENNLKTAKYYNIFTTLIYDDDDEKNVLLAIYDITEEVLLNKKLEEAQRIAQLGNWELDFVNNKLSWSEEIYKIFGVTPQDFKGDYDSFLQIVHPSDKEIVDKAFKQSLVTKKTYELEHRIITSNLELKYVREKCKTDFDENGAPLKSTGIVIDITDKKRAELNLVFNELKYRTIINTANDAILIADAKTGYIVEANNRASILFKKTHDKIIGTYQTALFPEEYNDLVKKEFDMIAKGTSKTFHEAYVIDADGVDIPVEISSSVIEIKENVYIVGIIRDVTERKRNETKILIQNKELKELNATKDKLFSIIAHDLKTPFNSLIGFSELLLYDFYSFSDEDKYKFIETIFDTAKNSFQLLTNLLDWARSQSGRINYKKEKINLKEAITNIVALIVNAANKKGIKINNEINEDIFITGDRNTVETVIRNLISNAIKYSYNNGEIFIKSSLVLEQRNKYFEVAIKDKGVGIEPERLEKIFDIENNISTRGTNDEGGTGLGLILCKEFIEKNGGKIRVESKKSEGSSFYITLPSE